MVSYGYNVFIATDQLVNALLAGSPDETFSARCYRSRVRDVAAESEKERWILLESIVDLVFMPQDWLVKRRGEWTGARHCERAYMSEAQRKHLPPVYATSTMPQRSSA